MENRSASVYLSFPSFLLSAKFVFNTLVDFERLAVAGLLLQVVECALAYAQFPHLIIRQPEDPASYFSAVNSQ